MDGLRGLRRYWYPYQMKDWTIQTLRDLDLKYAEEGIHPHQRPFHAASEILGDRFAIGVGANAEVERVTAAYEAMLSESNENWPGMGTGIAAVVDQVRRITAPVVFGAVSIQVWGGTWLQQRVGVVDLVQGKPPGSVAHMLCLCRSFRSDLWPRRPTEG